MASVTSVESPAPRSSSRGPAADVPRPRMVSDDAILDVAVALIGEGGPAQVTFAAVAERVGLAPATLVQRFGTKRGLLLAIALRGDPGRPEAWERARAEHESPLTALVDVFCGFSSEVGTPAAMANSLAFLHLDLSDPEFHVLARDGMAAMRERIAELLDAAVAAGELRPVDTRRLAGAIQNSYNGALITWAIYAEGRVEDWLRRELDHVLAPARAAHPAAPEGSSPRPG